MGWTYHLTDPLTATAVIGGQKIAVGEIRAVVTRLPWVAEHELVSITPGDRPYVASEMSAFLAFWLSDLKCPVLNRPAAGSLNGPPWRREEWLMLARRLGLPVPSVRRRSSLSSVLMPETEPVGITVTVVGDYCVGDADRSLLEGSRELARAAKVESLAIRFSDPTADATLLDVSPYPDLDSTEVADAMLHRIQESVASVTAGSSI